MKHKNPTYIRNKNYIIEKVDDNTNRQTAFRSINAAKRHSAGIQKSNGGLGCGILRVKK